MKVRKRLQTSECTNVEMADTDKGILLKQVTAASIERGFGMLKRKLGGKSFKSGWAENKRAERKLEETRDRPV